MLPNHRPNSGYIKTNRYVYYKIYNFSLPIIKLTINLYCFKLLLYQINTS